MNKTYEKLDSLIIKAVSDNNIHPIFNHNVAVEALRIARETCNSDLRVVDGRLRALCKAGVVRYFYNTKSQQVKIGCGRYLV